PKRTDLARAQSGGCDLLRAGASVLALVRCAERLLRARDELAARIRPAASSGWSSWNRRSAWRSSPGVLARGIRRYRRTQHAGPAAGRTRRPGVCGRGQSLRKVTSKFSRPSTGTRTVSVTEPVVPVV